MKTPTTETYGSLEQAYDHFNRELFAGQLPPCLLTLQRKGKRTLGFFSPARFTGDHATSDELAMNPRNFADRSITDVLATLAHEMTHVEQEHFGKPGRRGYHNKEWGQLMKRVGLYPSNTGEAGGKETGQQMTHYVVPNGPFERVCKALIGRGFRLKWGEGEPDETGREGKKGGDADRSNRARFRCPSCPAKAWGKPTLKLMCGKCRADMVVR